jgi:hypothetical protein
MHATARRLSPGWALPAQRVSLQQLLCAQRGNEFAPMLTMNGEYAALSTPAVFIVASLYAIQR